MNAWVTHYTTTWLMGPSKVEKIMPEESSLENYVVTVEKCRFLEESGCLKTCINACKIPTQDFFSRDMGITVTLKPNTTDLSCRFEFGVTPDALEIDPISQSSCLSACQQKTGLSRETCLTTLL
jgi:Beta-carotene isomerase D27-like, C-terminal